MRSLIVGGLAQDNHFINKVDYHSVYKLTPDINGLQEICLQSAKLGRKSSFLMIGASAFTTDFLILDEDNKRKISSEETKRRPVCVSDVSPLTQNISLQIQTNPR